MQQAVRISDRTAFFLLGEMVEFGVTESLFSMPRDKQNRRLHHREVWMMRNRFDQQLEQLHADLITMGGL